MPRSDKETKVPEKQPSSLHEEESDDSSESSGRTISNKSTNKYKIVHQKMHQYLPMFLHVIFERRFFVNVIDKTTFFLKM